MLLENDTVRVLRVTLTSGDKIPMPSHPDIVVYTIRGAQVRFIDAQGNVIEVSNKAGGVDFKSAVTHLQAHPDAGEARVIEIKK